MPSPWRTTRPVKSPAAKVTTMRGGSTRSAVRTSTPSLERLAVVPIASSSPRRSVTGSSTYVDADRALPADAHAVLDLEADPAVVAGERALLKRPGRDR